MLRKCWVISVVSEKDQEEAVKASLPHINLMMTGGVSLENMSTWFKVRVVAVGVDGNLLAQQRKGTL